MPAIVFEDKSHPFGHLIVRYPTVDDLQSMWQFINQISNEQTFVTFQGEEITLEDEQKYLESLLKDIEERQKISLLVFINEKLVGVSSVEMSERIQQHTGRLGIIIAKDFRGKGVGKKMMQLILVEAENKLPQLKIILLEVFANNPLAIKLYQSFGFKQYGVLPEGIKYKDGFVDEFLMYKKIK